MGHILSMPGLKPCLFRAFVCPLYSPTSVSNDKSKHGRGGKTRDQIITLDVILGVESQEMQDAKLNCV